jgi:hypothetical protein
MNNSSVNRKLDRIEDDNEDDFDSEEEWRNLMKEERN